MVSQCASISSRSALPLVSIAEKIELIMKKWLKKIEGVEPSSGVRMAENNEIKMEKFVHLDHSHDPNDE